MSFVTLRLMYLPTAEPGDQPRAPSHWTIADVDWNRIDRDRARGDELLYSLVTTASFVESGSDLYSSNLAAHVPDPAARAWFRDGWQPEELQHGRALRKYVETVWPELDWQRGFEGFFAEYGALCTLEALDPSPALEMVARCVVEVGTATLYTALHRGAGERVLRELCGRISRDEVRHYNHFRRFFEALQPDEKIGRLAILRKLCTRLVSAEGLDTYIGFKHAWLMRNPGCTFQDRHFKAFMSEVRAMMRIHFPYRMAMKMLLRPLDVGPVLVRISLPQLERAARRLLFAA